MSSKTDWTFVHAKDRRSVVVPERDAKTSADARRIAARQLGCMPEEIFEPLTRTIRGRDAEEEARLLAGALPGEVVWSF